MNRPAVLSLLFLWLACGFEGATAPIPPAGGERLPMAAPPSAARRGHEARWRSEYPECWDAGRIFENLRSGAEDYLLSTGSAGADLELNDRANGFAVRSPPLRIYFGIAKHQLDSCPAERARSCRISSLLTVAGLSQAWAFRNYAICIWNVFLWHDASTIWSKPGEKGFPTSFTTRSSHFRSCQGRSECSLVKSHLAYHLYLQIPLTA